VRLDENVKLKGRLLLAGRRQRQPDGNVDGLTPVEIVGDELIQLPVSGISQRRGRAVHPTDRRQRCGADMGTDNRTVY